MTWFKRQSGELDTSGEKTVRTEGLWVKCDNCRQIIWKKDLEENLNVCPKCSHHMRIDGRELRNTLAHAGAVLDLQGLDVTVHTNALGVGGEKLLLAIRPERLRSALAKENRYDTTSSSSADSRQRSWACDFVLPVKTGIHAGLEI